MNGTATSRFAHGIETALPLAPAQNYFQLSGWAHLPGSAKPCALRIVVGEQVFAPSERHERADVAEHYPADPGALHSGFKFLCYLPFGLRHGALEASSDDGVSWQRLRTLAIPVGAHPLQGAVEFAGADRRVSEPVRIEGWVHHPEFAIREVVLQFGNIEVPCDYGLPRPDVARGLGFNPKHDAANSGFITTENLPRGEGTVRIRALTQCGRIYFLDTDLRVAIETGWGSKPPPPTPIPDLSTVAWAPPPPALDARRTESGLLAPGSRNILFVLHGDFGSNSALHVAALANAMIAQGYDCVVAVPGSKATLGALNTARFVAIEFDELSRLGGYFKNGRGPMVTHAWTPRERIRKFCQKLMAEFATSLVVHLEDNEFEITEKATDTAFAALAELPADALDRLVPDDVMHPIHGPRFLNSASGVSVLVDRLCEHCPDHLPCCEFWPAADPTVYHKMPRNDELRTALGIPPATTVLFYHGNVHAANAGEVGELYAAVARLNAAGHATLLIRTGRDATPPPADDAEATASSHVLHLGFIEHARYLPTLMAMADIFVQPGSPGAFNDYRFPSKLPEFFALGRPVVLPRSNIGHAIRHGIDAWVLDDANASTIAEAIIHLRKHPELSTRLADGAVAFAEKHFSWEQNAAKLVTFYRELTALAPVETLS